MVCSRWSQVFVKDFTIFEVSRTEGYVTPIDTEPRIGMWETTRVKRVRE